MLNYQRVFIDDFPGEILHYSGISPKSTTAEVSLATNPKWVGSRAGQGLAQFSGPPAVGNYTLEIDFLKSCLDKS